MWSPKGTTLRVIRCPTLQVSQFLFRGQRSDTFLTDHVFLTIMGIYLFFSFFLFMFVIKIAKLHPDFLMLEIMFSVLASEQVTCSPTCHCSHCNIFANSFH